MDKKPYRVTNEQVQKICTTSYNFRDQVTGVTTVDIATDLQDARELIDKQEAIIKEMRSMVEVIRDNSLNPAHTMTQLGLEETTDANHKLALTILEKSKDYA